MPEHFTVFLVVSQVFKCTTDKTEWRLMPIQCHAGYLLAFIVNQATSILCRDTHGMIKWQAVTPLIFDHSAYVVVSACEFGFERFVSSLRHKTFVEPMVKIGICSEPIPYRR